MPINWYRGSPSILQSQVIDTGRELGAYGQMGRGVRGAYDALEAQRQKNIANKATLTGLRSQLGELAASAAGPTPEESGVEPGLHGPGETTAPDPTTVSPEPAEEEAAQRPTGPYQGDESFAIGGMRKLANLLHLPGVDETQPGPSSAERIAELRGRTQMMADELAKAKAAAPYVRGYEGAPAAARAVAPHALGAIPEDLGRYRGIYGGGTGTRYGAMARYAQALAGEGNEPSPEHWQQAAEVFATRSGAGSEGYTTIREADPEQWRLTDGMITTDPEHPEVVAGEAEALPRRTTTTRTPGALPPHMDPTGPAERQLGERTKRGTDFWVEIPD
jgi:hypothetical protein